MAVYTEVSFEQAERLIQELELGQLLDISGCPGGIENTNYFLAVEADGATREWVLTLFERLSAAQLPFYLRLMKHLAAQGMPVPDPASDAKGSILHSLQGKPTAVVNRLSGKSELAPSAEHCAMVGAMVARLHLAARDFDMLQPNLRGLPWWNETVPTILPFLSASQAVLMRAELAHQNHLAAQPLYRALPRGPVHADLFRDNVMFDAQGGKVHISGIFDFYFAGVDNWLFDLAVCLNDWCLDLQDGRPDLERTRSLLDAYCEVRPMLSQEREMLNGMLRAAALRFWISRLWDLHLPRSASILTAHDPGHFERVLRQRVQNPVRLETAISI